MSSCQLPLSPPEGQHNPQCTAGTFLCIVLHGGCWSCPFLSCWEVAGQDCSSQLWCTPRTEKQRNPIQPGSRQHWLVFSNTWLLPSQQNRIALCLQSMCVCVCVHLHAWVHANKLSKSTLSSLSVLWRCATPQILEKPCGAIYFIFEHC